MILLDTNILILLRKKALSRETLTTLRTSSLDTCNIIIAETLGYMTINPGDETYFRNLFNSMSNHIFSYEVTNKVIELRKTTNIKLPDAIIAATALVNNLELWTHNIKDFEKIPGIKVYDPIPDLL